MEALAIIAGIVVAVWGAIVFLRGGLVGGCLAVLLAGTCFSVPFFKIELGPVPLTVDRILLALLLVQYVFWRRFGWAEPKPLGKPDFFFIAFVAAIVLSTFSADWRTHNSKPVAWLIVNYIMPVAVFWIARQSRWTERAALAAFGCMAAFGVYLSVTALAEYFQATWLVFPKYIVTSAQEAGAEFVGRGRGPLLHPIGNGIMLSVCLGGLLMWWPRSDRRWRIVITVVAALYMAAFYCSLTRSVWMGAAVTLAIAAWPMIPPSKRLPLLGLGILAATIVVVAQWQNLVGFKRDKELSAEQTAESVELRPILATIAWKMFLDRPVFGCGYAQYEYEHLNYVSDRSTRLALERGRGYIQHNVVLSLLTETGLVGLGLFLTTIAFWFCNAWRLCRDAEQPLWIRQAGLLFLIALGAYFVNGMFHDVSVVPMANMTLFFLAGMVAGLASSLASAWRTSM